MSVLQDIQNLAVKKVPVIRPGNTVKIHQKIKEGEKERIQIFEGLVIKLNSGYGADKTITVRKIVGGIGVEKIFPLYSTNIVKIEVKKKSKVRRSKLYYMRSRSGKSARLKETFVSDKELEDSIEELAEKKAKEEEATAEETGTTEETATTEEAPKTEEADAPKEEAKAAEEAPTAEDTPAEEEAEKKE
jgi:large subunit ribosomal protein L19